MSIITKEHENGLSSDEDLGDLPITLFYLARPIAQAESDALGMLQSQLGEFAFIDYHIGIDSSEDRIESSAHCTPFIRAWLASLDA